MTTVYLVRHAAAAGNTDRFFQGHMDGQISEKGRLQLEALSARFESVRLSAVISSPLSRAMETAKAVNSGSGVEISTDRRLVEINGGVLEGVRWADLPALFPEDAEAWSLRPWDFSPENGESMRQVMDRMSGAMSDIARRHDGQTIGVVSHGCSIRAFLCSVMYGDIMRLNEVEWSDNTAVTLLTFQNGVFSIIEANDAGHLSDDISTFATQTWWKKSERGKMNFDD